MYKYILESVDNINWLAIIPLIIFFLFFITTIILVVKKKKYFIKKMENLPFEENKSSLN